MRLVSEREVRAPRRTHDQHPPSLLPAFKGLHTHEQALAAGVTEHGASVHVVSAELDGGPVIAQARVPVLAGDDAAALAQRVLRARTPAAGGDLAMAGCTVASTWLRDGVTLGRRAAVRPAAARRRQPTLVARFEHPSP